MSNSVWLPCYKSNLIETKCVTFSVKIKPDDLFTLRNITSWPGLLRTVPSVINDVITIFINELHCSWPASYTILKTYLCNFPCWVYIDGFFLIIISTLALKHWTFYSIGKLKLESSYWKIRFIITFPIPYPAQLHFSNRKFSSLFKSRPFMSCFKILITKCIQLSQFYLSSFVSK